MSNSNYTATRASSGLRQDGFKPLDKQNQTVGGTMTLSTNTSNLHMRSDPKVNVINTVEMLVDYGEEPKPDNAVLIEWEGRTVDDNTVLRFYLDPDENSFKVSVRELERIIKAIKES